VPQGGAGAMFDIVSPRCNGSCAGYGEVDESERPVARPCDTANVSVTPARTMTAVE